MADLVNSFLNLAVPPATMMMLAFSWPALCFINACEWLYNTLYTTENMDGKVVIITGASSGIGEQIAYEYAKRRANLVLVARREQRLRAISEKARYIGANSAMVIAADVVKEDECRRFVNETINFYGRVDHLVNAASLGHTFYFDEVADTSVFPILLDINFWGNVYPTFVALPYLQQTNGRVIVNASVENWLPLPRMSLYAAAKAALLNFYDTLRLEVNDEVGITIATHGWIGGEMTSGKFMLEEGAEMQWKEEREVQASGGPVEEFARLIVSGACRGDAYVKYPSWHDSFLLFRVFAPKVLNWSFRLLLSTHGTRRTSMVGVGKLKAEGSTARYTMESTSPRRLPAGPITFSQKME
ncbi:11-beta-hydroxysteroid dehydrogenase-like 5 [Hibiscus syriacus]|uniref:11-beta-hydroxysteroid dehydrogenase-like 5 n=1 Tax=Hibiscus syriacus TaxID=106335 RepID=A0A6A3AFA9_HIBSY|nr:11-beta-hydroxysteroid dehydrogenase B-like [Hibiscus syriacus]KAE8701875.1 11-beta-hydroxysteroid dehydrogenase-like 5 [Hibiscus syriacus]